MTPREKLTKLVKYAENLKSRISDPSVPEKRKSHPKEYREFLERDLQKTLKKIDSLKLFEDKGR